MILDEKLRWAGFWILDGLRGGQTRKYYDRIRYAWKEGSSVAETEERIQNLIRHAVKTTDFYKDLRAVQEGHIYEIDDNMISRQGPRLAQAFEALAQIIHPETK